MTGGRTWSVARTHLQSAAATAPAVSMSGLAEMLTVSAPPQVGSVDAVAPSAITSVESAVSANDVLRNRMADAPAVIPSSTVEEASSLATSTDSSSQAKSARPRKRARRNPSPKVCVALFSSPPPRSHNDGSIGSAATASVAHGGCDGGGGARIDSTSLDDVGFRGCDHVVNARVGGGARSFSAPPEIHSPRPQDSVPRPFGAISRSGRLSAPIGGIAAPVLGRPTFGTGHPLWIPPRCVLAGA
eukprot:TRINITY_DN32660_c0_g1_i1.p1 TRINITY_DN32660_c0_g1~~TRINITY_DN32660_c0_g1_i1.p1  ORF type:complete len:244 (+),score=20.78 TRINITY_DN32660_c0_g1_i1:102-833(+)